jgi:hypothetical protein
MSLASWRLQAVTAKDVFVRCQQIVDVFDGFTSTVVLVLRAGDAGFVLSTLLRISMFFTSTEWHPERCLYRAVQGENRPKFPRFK